MTTREDYEAFLGEVRKATGMDFLVADEGGLASVRVDDAYTVNLQYVEATGKVLCFIETMKLPAGTDKTVYRDLLAGGLFGRLTAGGYFALEPETETVVYNYFFDLEKAAADVEDFVASLEKILQLCDMWVERVKGIMSGGETAHQPSRSDLHFYP